MVDRPTRQQWDQAWLPLWPLASDDLLAGVYRMSRHDALGLRYIEANPQAMSNLLVVDVDHPDSALRALGTRPLPHVIVENTRNGHAHAVWALQEPVTRTEYAHRRPLAYAASVTEGLRRAVDGDKAYSGLITKNPLHADWSAYQVASLDQLYNLDQIAEGLGSLMPPRNWRQQKARRANPAGLGRNCALFDEARIWAYREARRIRQRNEHATAQDSADLLAAIRHEIATRNACFNEPLPTSEAHAIAASIHRWITCRFYGWTDSRTVNEATFTTIQSARGKKSGEARRTARDGRLASL